MSPLLVIVIVTSLLVPFLHSLIALAPVSLSVSPLLPQSHSCWPQPPFVDDPWLLLPSSPSQAATHSHGPAIDLVVIENSLTSSSVVVGISLWPPPSFHNSLPFGPPQPFLWPHLDLKFSYSAVLRCFISPSPWPHLHISLWFFPVTTPYVYIQTFAHLLPPSPLHPRLSTLNFSLLSFLHIFKTPTLAIHLAKGNHKTSLNFSQSNLKWTESTALLYSFVKLFSHFQRRLFHAFLLLYSQPMNSFISQQM